MEFKKFKIKCTKSEIRFCKEGNVYEFINGSTTWASGNTSARYEDFSDFIERNKSLEDHFIEFNESETIVIYRKGNDVIAASKEGKETIKSETATCHPDDKFIFNDGAKIAFSRLTGEEVKKLDEQTTIVKQDTYEVGDKVKVRSDLKLHKIYSENRIVEDMMKFLGKIVTIKAVYNNEYNLKEVNYYWSSEMFEGKVIKSKSSTYKEVNRIAKLGEFVKIINAEPSTMTTIHYKNGDILKIIKVDEDKVRYGSKMTEFLFSREYIVLENYNPLTTSLNLDLSKVTDDELTQEIIRRLAK